MYALFINISVRNWHFTAEEGKALHFLIKPVYYMTWIWALHGAHNKLKNPIEEDNIWVTLRYEPFNLMVANFNLQAGVQKVKSALSCFMSCSDKTCHPPNLSY